VPSALLFKAALDRGLKLPKFVWDVSEDGTSITVITSSADSLVEVMMWSATNPDARDFRMNTFGPHWSAETLSEVASHEYLANVSMPATGATAYMVELTYNIGGQDLKFTTDISVVENPVSVAVPEPASCALLMSGIAVVLLVRSRSKRHRESKV
jgi:PhoPQ-activated pathogenicity-related protein